MTVVKRQAENLKKKKNLQNTNTMNNWYIEYTRNPQNSTLKKKKTNNPI